MDERTLRQMLEDVQAGALPVDQAVERLRRLPFEELDHFARLDTHRALRCGFPEVVLAQGKTPGQVLQILTRLAEANPRVLATRVTPELYEAIRQHIPQAVYHPAARMLVIQREPPPEQRTGILIVTGGTADIPVAEEAALTAEVMGNRVERLYDVGVAGLHRLLASLDALRRARVIVVAAGMDGAIASVVGGLVEAPVIAVPTSVGYGANFQGLGTLLAMLNACSSGVAVVNVDNGYGAGYLASLINRIGARTPTAAADTAAAEAEAAGAAL